MPAEHEREQFSNQLEYILSVLGFAAGYGSVWRFPYLVYKNGGGVFLIPYFLIVVAVGIPSFYFETGIGQMTRRSPPLCLESVHKKWKGLGVFSILITLNMCTYYNLILAYSFYYFFLSFISPLPWAQTPEQPSLLNMDYFYKSVLQASSGLGEIGNVVWPIFFCFIISQIIVYFCIRKGVTVSGKISLITATSPFILLFVLMLRGFFLSGAGEGLSYLLSPDWSKLFSAEVWVDAANQVLFQVSTGTGVIIIFGSYRPKNKEILKSSYVIIMLTILCGMLASLVIFSFMGHMSQIMETSIDNLPLKGPDLAFIVFPAILSTMPFSNLLSIIFYVVMIFLGIDTQFAQIDAVSATIEDELRNEGVSEDRLKNVRAYVCIAVSLSAFLYCSQAGFFYLEFVDDYTASINLFACLFMQSILFFFIEKWEKIETQIVQHVQEPTPEYMVYLMKYSVTVFSIGLATLALFIQIKDILAKAWWVSMLGWAITLYPYYFLYYYYNKYKDDSKAEDYQTSKAMTLQLMEF